MKKPSSVLVGEISTFELYSLTMIFISKSFNTFCISIYKNAMVILIKTTFNSNDNINNNKTRWSFTNRMMSLCKKKSWSDFNKHSFPPERYNKKE